MTKAYLNTKEIEQRLAIRYSGMDWGFLPQVPSSTGGASTTADAIACSLWPSRGIYLIGFEIKASRSDWLRELKNPKKADTIARYCRQWYIVAGHESIVAPGELPDTWGLMIPHGTGLKVKTEAQKMIPEPLSLKFFASLLRNAQRHSPSEVALQKAREAVRKEMTERHERQYKDLKSSHDTLTNTVSLFERASGLHIRYAPAEEIRRIGHLVASIKDEGFDLRGNLALLSRIRDMSTRLNESINKSINDLETEIHNFIESKGNDATKVQMAGKAIQTPDAAASGAGVAGD